MKVQITHTLADTCYAKALELFIKNALANEELTNDIRFSCEQAKQLLSLDDIWSCWFSSQAPGQGCCLVILSQSSVKKPWIDWSANTPNVEKEGKNIYLGRSEGINEGRRCHWPFIYQLNTHQFPTPSNLASSMRSDIQEELTLLLSTLTKQPYGSDYQITNENWQVAIDQYIKTVAVYLEENHQA